MSDSIMAALARGDDSDRIVNREVLRAAVMRQITCPWSGHVLDVRTAVYFRVVTPGGQSGAECVSGASWDGRADAMRAVCEAKNIELEVIDGRML